jgi:hypothetical protein
MIYCGFFGGSVRLPVPGPFARKHRTPIPGSARLVTFLWNKTGTWLTSLLYVDNQRGPNFAGGAGSRPAYRVLPERRVTKLTSQAVRA